MCISGFVYSHIFVCSAEVVPRPAWLWWCSTKTTSCTSWLHQTPTVNQWQMFMTSPIRFLTLFKDGVQPVQPLVWNLSQYSAWFILTWSARSMFWTKSEDDARSRLRQNTVSSWQLEICQWQQWFINFRHQLMGHWTTSSKLYQRSKATRMWCLSHALFLAMFAPSDIFAWSFSSANDELDNFDKIGGDPVESRLPAWLPR